MVLGGGNPEIARIGREQLVRDTMVKRLGETLKNYGREDVDAKEVYAMMTDDEKKNLFQMNREDLQKLHNALVARAIPEEVTRSSSAMHEEKGESASA